MSKGNPNIANLDNAVKPQLGVGKNTCQCADCSTYFGGVGSFERHLVRDPESEQAIQCLNADGMRAIGMVENPHGVWLRGVSKKQYDAEDEAA